MKNNNRYNVFRNNYVAKYENNNIKVYKIDKYYDSEDNSIASALVTILFAAIFIVSFGLGGFLTNLIILPLLTMVYMTIMYFTVTKEKSDRSKYRGLFYNVEKPNYITQENWDKIIVECLPMPALIKMVINGLTKRIIRHFII